MGVKAAGVDTWSVGWYLRDGSPAQRAADVLCTDRGPGCRLLPSEIAGHRIGYFGASRLLFAEGHPTEGGLAGADELPASFERLSESLCDLGILPPSYDLRPVGGPKGAERAVTGGAGFAGIRRLDSTVNLHFDSPVDGLAALAGVAALPLPRMKTTIKREVGGRRVETVYLHGWSGRRILGRWYDKGVESGEAPRGQWVRPEDQRRYTAETRPPLEAVASSTYVRDSFVRRFEPLWKAAKGVKVGGVLELARQLRQLQEEGAITPTEAKRLAGHICLDAADAQLQSRATICRDRALCREHGLVLADGVLDEVEVDLGAVLEECLEADAWGRRG